MENGKFYVRNGETKLNLYAKHLFNVVILLHNIYVVTLWTRKCKVMWNNLLMYVNFSIWPSACSLVRSELFFRSAWRNFLIFLHAVRVSSNWKNYAAQFFEKNLALGFLGQKCPKLDFSSFLKNSCEEFSWFFVWEYNIKSYGVKLSKIIFLGF